jgi:hypothetical protein
MVAQLPYQDLVLLRRTRDADNPGAQNARDLSGKVTDAARSPGYNDRLAGSHLAYSGEPEIGSQTVLPKNAQIVLGGCGHGEPADVCSRNDRVFLPAGEGSDERADRWAVARCSKDTPDNRAGDGLTYPEPGTIGVGLHNRASGRRHRQQDVLNEYLVGLQFTYRLVPRLEVSELEGAVGALAHNDTRACDGKYIGVDFGHFAFSHIEASCSGTGTERRLCPGVAA